MTINELRNSYIEFFVSKGHAHIQSASLIPENDPTVLFTTAGMHPLVPYLLGETHPKGRRLVDWQKCVRTGDIDAVGDSTHLTFFEMLGNWSLGDYFKKEAIEWSFEFLTSILGFNRDLINVTVFEGDSDAPRDEESAGYWRSLGIPAERVFFKPKEDNWWGPAGLTGPCGPDTEMFIDIGTKKCSDQCSPGCRCGKYIEIWNDVFMQYNKTESGEFVPLKQTNVDTGMGIERTIAMLSGKKNVYETEAFDYILKEIEELSGKSYTTDDAVTRAFRIVADHVRTAVFIIGDERGISPSNVGSGYVLRRLIRRAVRYGKQLEINGIFLSVIAKKIINRMASVYPELVKNTGRIIEELDNEERKFEATINSGLNELEKLLNRLMENNQTELSGRLAFKLYDTYGFPIEFTCEIAAERGFKVDLAGFEEAYDKHKQASKDAQAKNFKGGLADNSEATTKLHTATHLLHRALKSVLGDHVNQKGSNITAERLRFDFTHNEKMTEEQVRAVEKLVNDQIDKKMPVTMELMTLENAKSCGAIALFGDKYDEQVKVYTMGDFSKEVCGGPHVENTGILGKFRIVKEEASSAGVRRIRAVLE